MVEIGPVRVSKELKVALILKGKANRGDLRRALSKLYRILKKNYADEERGYRIEVTQEFVLSPAESGGKNTMLVVRVSFIGNHGIELSRKEQFYSFIRTRMTSLWRRGGRGQVINVIESR